MSGTWLGYALANIWCYGLGVVVVTVAAPGTDLVTALTGLEMDCVRESSQLRDVVVH